MKKICQVALLYKKIKSKYQKADISIIDLPLGVSEYPENPLNNILMVWTKLYTPSTPNIDIILWHTHWIVCAVKLITHDLIHDFHFTFQAYTLPHTLNGMFVSLFKFHT